jgi:hypothetical protein
MTFAQLLATLQCLTPDELQKSARLHLPGTQDGEAVSLEFITDRHGQKRIPYLTVEHRTSNFLEQLCQCGDSTYHP